MPAHVIYPKVDHATGRLLEHRWLNDILRHLLGFTVASIFSDDLSMAGARKIWTARKASATPKRQSPGAGTAGCDMVLLCNQSRRWRCRRR
jgi:beta-N-acetylhexosaminidase